MTDNETNTHSVNSDERLLGMFSHLSIFFGGLIIPLIFWVINKDKSRYVTFHSLQSLWFHITFIVIIICFAMLVVLIALAISLIFAPGNKPDNLFAFPLIMILLYGSIFVFIFGFMGYSVYMGIKAYQGELVKYPVIGKIIYRKVYGI